jgi:hypothetical protein
MIRASAKKAQLKARTCGASSPIETASRESRNRSHKHTILSFASAIVTDLRNEQTCKCLREHDHDQNLTQMKCLRIVVTRQFRWQKEF